VQHYRWSSASNWQRARASRKVELRQAKRKKHRVTLQQHVTVIVSEFRKPGVVFLRHGCAPAFRYSAVPAFFRLIRCFYIFHGCGTRVARVVTRIMFHHYNAVNWCVYGLLLKLFLFIFIKHLFKPKHVMFVEHVVCQSIIHLHPIFNIYYFNICLYIRIIYKYIRLYIYLFIYTFIYF